MYKNSVSSVLPLSCPAPLASFVWFSNQHHYPDGTGS